MRCAVPSVVVVALLAAGCREAPPPSGTSEAGTAGAWFKDAPLVTSHYTADPSAHVFDGRIYIYPSHDVDAGIPSDDAGSHFAMRDYRVYSMERIDGPVTDHGVVLDVDQVPWAARQLWAPDAAMRDGRYFLYFPAKDEEGVFRIGVAVADTPAGPFTADPMPIDEAVSIDPAVFTDVDGASYMYFGGIWGGQLQRWTTGSYQPEDSYPSPEAPAIAPRVARLRDDMRGFAEPPREVLILDEGGQPITAGDNARRFFEAAWLHKRGDTYYLSYSTGDTHYIVYATGESPYGPFTYRGRILEPVLGWTSHHSIVEVAGQWLLFYHDAQRSGGQTHLRNIKVTPLRHREDGSIETLTVYRPESGG